MNAMLRYAFGWLTELLTDAAAHAAGVPLDDETTDELLELGKASTALARVCLDRTKERFLPSQKTDGKE